MLYLYSSIPVKDLVSPNNKGACQQHQNNTKASCHHCNAPFAYTSIQR